MPDIAADPEYIRGLINPEDLARVPNTSWVITSGLTSVSHPQGHLYLVNAEDRSFRELYPHPDARHELDRDTYGDANQPDASAFSAHGLGLRVSDDGVHTLYVVNHGGREAVEVFTLDANGDEPVLTWVGVVQGPDWAWLNDVAPHPDGGFLVTNTATGLAAGFDKIYAGEPSGNVLRWRGHGAELSVVPGGEGSAPNGVEVSSDGSWCFVCWWGTNEVAKVSLTDPSVPPVSAKVNFHPDNLTWSQDGQHLLTTGQIGDAQQVLERFHVEDRCGFPFEVVRINAETMEVEVLVAHDAPDDFGTAASALEVGDEVWVGSARNDAVAIFGPSKAGVRHDA